ncbi:MAG: hypothetical protein WC523_02005 [Patescibacteria group bacterium]|jgi:hypothetical protein
MKKITLALLLIILNFSAFNAFAQILGEPLEKTDSLAKEDWEAFYSKVFHRQYDFSKIQMPRYETRYNQIIIVPQGLSYQTIFSILTGYEVRKKISLNINQDLKIRDVRNNTKSYAVRIRTAGCETVYGEFAHCDDLWGERVSFGSGNYNSITLKEYLLLFLKKYFMENKILNNFRIETLGSIYEDLWYPEISFFKDYYGFMELTFGSSPEFEGSITVIY